MNPVLVTDGILRKSLAAVRSLGSKGIHVLSSDMTRITPAGCSKFCKGSLRYPSPAASAAAFSQWLADFAASIPGLVIFPMDDITVSAILDHQETIKKKAPECIWLLPERESFRRAADKYEALKMADALGLDIPRTWWPQNPDELRDICSEAEYPLVIKPRNSSGSRGIRIVRNREELMLGYEELKAYYPLPMIQEYIPPGTRFDVALLYDSEGSLIASFAQKEVRHYPADIGPSTVQESVWMPELVERSAGLVSAFQWRGIAEVEWMRDPRDGKLKLMEINPRYWNSLHLAVQSGVDFPYLHYLLATGRGANRQHTYEIGQITRNLLPGDLLHAISTKNFMLDPPLFKYKGLPIQDDILSLSDPWATAGFIGACVRYLFDRRMWKTVIRR